MEITTANVHDAAELEAVLPPEPGAVYGDSAFAGARPEGVIRVRGGTPRIVHTSTWGGPEALARLEAHNAEVRRVRARIEKVFGTVKRCYGLRRMRWLGLAKAGLQVRLAAMAYNLRRSWHSCRREARSDSAPGGIGHPTAASVDGEERLNPPQSGTKQPSSTPNQLPAHRSH